MSQKSRSNLTSADTCHDLCQVAAAIRDSGANLRAAEDAGGFERVTQLLQWAALTFPGNGTQKGQPEDEGTPAPRSLLHKAASSGASPAPFSSSPFPRSPRSMTDDGAVQTSPRRGDETVSTSYPVTPLERRSGAPAMRMQSLNARFMGIVWDAWHVPWQEKMNCLSRSATSGEQPCVVFPAPSGPASERAIATMTVLQVT